MPHRPLLAVALAATTLSAQQPVPGPRVTVGQLDLDTYRYAISAERRSIMEANIGLDVERRLKFFALYESYDKDREPLDTERFSALKRYADAQMSLSDPPAMALVRAVAVLQIKEIQLRSRYADRFEREMGAKVAARFYQVDDVITTAIRLNSLQSIPLAAAPAH